MPIDNLFKKKDHYVRYFTGATYEIDRFNTLGELRAWLEAVAKDLPEDDNLKIDNLELDKGKLTYILADQDSIFTDGD
ncbi:MAG: hypothetical protein Q7S55_00075 [Nanoarchaeota archaeon]|nr:hypothetical protein [Nanoarchaeota archaeon]